MLRWLIVMVTSCFGCSFDFPVLFWKTKAIPPTFRSCFVKESMQLCFSKISYYSYLAYVLALPRFQACEFSWSVQLGLGLDILHVYFGYGRWWKLNAHSVREHLEINSAGNTRLVTTKPGDRPISGSAWVKCTCTCVVHILPFAKNSW